MLTDRRDQTYTLPALCAEAEGLLRAAGPPPEDERVTAFPDVRTVRYYQSLGLVDKPLRYDGRQAIYGYRHLLQVLTVKVLQTESFSLAQLQQSLAGFDDARLEAALAQVLPTQTGPPPPAETELLSPFLTVELGPGLLLTVDTRVHPAPLPLIHTLRHALSEKP